MANANVANANVANANVANANVANANVANVPANLYASKETVNLKLWLCCNHPE